MRAPGMGHRRLRTRLYRHYAEPSPDQRFDAYRRRLHTRLGLPPSPPPATRRFILRRPVPIAIVLVVLTAGAVFAATTLTNLGKPTNATDQYVPLGSFQHVGTPLRSNFRTELLFLGSQWDIHSDTEIWPIVKALDQFGSFRHIAPLERRNHFPTFDWRNAVYASRYVEFVHKSLLDAGGHHDQRLSSGQEALIRRYVHPASGAGDAAVRIALSPNFPVTAVGGYLEAGPGVFTSADIQAQGAPVPSFQALAHQMQQGYSRHFVQAVYDMNAEANIITALICHADGKQPKKVCNRTAIEQILKHVK